MTKWIPLIVGGLSGTVCRYLVSGSIFKAFGDRFPYGTLAVNVTGCFLLGLFAIIAEGKLGLSPHTKLLLTVGFCGAYTTFSTLILETSHLMQDGRNGYAFMNLAVSIILGFIALKLGVLLGDFLQSF